MIKPFTGEYPMTRGFVAADPNMPINLRDPLYGATHRGVDWALPAGIPLLAADSGKVTYAGFSPDGAGNTIVIKASNFYIKYFHLSSIAVGLGQQVNRGQIIGSSGATGNVTGPHLHFQVEQGMGNAVDPIPLIEGDDMEWKQRYQKAYDIAEERLASIRSLEAQKADLVKLAEDRLASINTLIKEKENVVKIANDRLESIHSLLGQLEGKVDPAEFPQIREQIDKANKEMAEALAEMEKTKELLKG